MKIGIIGNGIIGTTLAYRIIKYLNNSDIEVLLFGEKERINSATTSAAAMLNSFAEIEHYNLDTELDNYKFELSQKATKMWPSFVEEIAIESNIELLQKSFRLGTFLINNSSADSLDDLNFQAVLKKLIGHKEAYEIIDPTNIPNYLPSPRFRAQSSIYIPNEGWINPNLLLHALETILLKSSNVTLYDMKVLNIGFNSDVFSLSTDQNSKFNVDILVLANGADMSRFDLEKIFGIKVQKLFYGVGTTIEIQSDFTHTNCIRTPNRGLACGVYSAPYVNHTTGNTNVIVGASNFISTVPEKFGRLSSIKNLLSSAEEQINRNFYKANLLSVNVGWRPISQDTYPLIGRTSIENLFIINGTKRDGFHFSPLISDQLTRQILSAEKSNDFYRFAPEREIFKLGNRELGIEMAVRHKLNAIYQHGFNSSDIKMEEALITSITKEVSEIYDLSSINDYAIPVEMLDMYKYKHAILK